MGMLVTMGIFNLITAVFIDNVFFSQNTRRQIALGTSMASTEARIKRLLSKFVIEKGSETNDQRLKDAFRQWEKYVVASGGNDRDACLDAVYEALQDADWAITRDIFNHWMENYELLEVLEDADIDFSNKYELFDILDADMGGELELQELVTGLMKLRGPVSKGDIIAIRLKVRHMSRLIDN